MQMKTNVKKYGGTLFLRLTPAIIEYLDIKEEQEMIIEDEEGKHGKYFSAWKKK